MLQFTDLTLDHAAREHALFCLERTGVFFDDLFFDHFYFAELVINNLLLVIVDDLTLQELVLLKLLCEVNALFTLFLYALLNVSVVQDVVLKRVVLVSLVLLPFTL